MAPPESLASKVLEQLNNPMNLLLLGSAGISLLLGHWDDATSIVLAVVLVSCVAFVQEYQTEKSLASLKVLSPFFARVIRSTNHTSIPATMVVPGDIVCLSAGDRVPGDVRIINSNSLCIDESSLTGENEPVYKVVSTGNEMELNESQKLHWSFRLPEVSGFHRIPIPERINSAFMGSLVISGNGIGVVVATGGETELGQICQMVNEIEGGKTPLQNAMDLLGKQLSFFSLIIIGFISLIGVIQGRPFLDMFNIGVSLAVAAIPEGLPIVVAVTLALGVSRMAKSNVILKSLPCVETLGSVSVICLDKTGTLTENKMTVTEVFIPSLDLIKEAKFAKVASLQDPSFISLVQSFNICNNAIIEADGKSLGQPTEIALLDFVLKMGFYDFREVNFGFKSTGL
jgi:Ca2+-transporting ATPase